MPLDTRIPLMAQPVQLPDQMAALSNLANIQNAQANNRLAQLKMQEAQQGLADRRTLADLAPQLRDPKTRDAALGKLPVEIAAKYQEFYSKADEATRKQLKDANEEAGPVLYSLNQVPLQQLPQAFQQAIAQFQANGRPIPADLPQSSDPMVIKSYVQSKLNQAIGLKGMMDQVDKNRTYNLQAGNASESRRHNIAMENKPNASTNINFGGLTPAVNKETGELTFVQPSNKGGVQAVTGYAPPPKEPTARETAAQDKVARIDDALSTIDAAIASTNENTVGARGAVNALVEAGSAQLGKPVGTQAGDRANLEAIIQSTSWRDLVGSGQLSKSDYSMLNRVTGGGLFTHSAQSKNDLVRLKQLLQKSKGGPRSDAKTVNMPSPKTDAEFGALPSGAVYIDPDDGKQYRKP